MCIEVCEKDKKFIMCDENNFNIWITKKMDKKLDIVKCNDFGKSDMWNRIYNIDINKKIKNNLNNKYIKVLDKFINSDNFTQKSSVHNCNIS